MEKKKQTMRFSDQELSLIKNTFAENDMLLTALRKLFLQMPLDVVDKNELSLVTGNKDVLKVVRKCYLPTLEPDAPFNQMVDLWMTVEIKDKQPEDVLPNLVARQVLLQYLEEQIDRLESGNYDVINGLEFASFVPSYALSRADALNAYVNLVARNTLISHNEWQVTQLSVLAGQKDETVEQTQKRLQQNSNK